MPNQIVPHITQNQIGLNQTLSEEERSHLMSKMRKGNAIASQALVEFLPVVLWNMV